MPIYDVENRFSYYKNYSDNILVGPPIPTMGSSIWQRSVSGSVVSGSEEWKAATLVSDYLFAKSSSFFRSGEVRYLRMVSEEQQIEDSIIPDPVELYATGSYGAGKLTWAASYDSVGNALVLLFATSSVAVITGSDSNNVSNTEWWSSYPFEKKYFQVPRNITDRSLYDIQTGYIYSQIPKINQFEAKQTKNLINKSNVVFVRPSFDIVAPYTKSLSALMDITGYYDPGLPSGGTYPDQWQYGGNNFGYVNQKMVSNFVFGLNSSFGESKVSAPSEGADGNYKLIRCWIVGCEGWKYGLYNGVPTNFSCVFRQNHYGQPRDMLEGRPYTKTYNNKEIGGPLDTDGGINFISGSALSGESNNWLTASIYGGTNVAAAYTVNPYGSGIFDKEYRASQPWFDNDPRLGT